MNLAGVIVLVVLGGVFLYALFGKPRKGSVADVQKSGSPDAQIGMLTGMLGGDTASAAEARFAIQRLEGRLGRPATDQEIATAVAASVASKR
jgi:hypothetical protein